MNQSSTPSDFGKVPRLIFVLVLIATITLLHYGTMEAKVHLHTLFRQLYFVPIVLVGMWYGLRVALFLSLVIVGLYLPHVLMTWKAQPGVNIGNMLETLVFILVAGVTGYLSDRERERFRQTTEAQNLAFLGKTSVAITAELQEVLKLLQGLVVSRDAANGRIITGELQGVIERITVLNQTMTQFSSEHPSQSRGFVEIASSIERVRRKLRVLARKKGVKIQLRLDPTSGFLQVNAADFLWVIEELTKNAIENSEPDQIVTVTSSCFEDRCEIAITDQGHGISAENLSKAFVPFYTTKAKGTGLGLPVCKKLMQDNGGIIHVQSKLGEGSTFTVTLPRLGAQEAEKEAA